MYKACIFDLDGTLTNTLDSLTYSTNKTLEEMGLETITKEQCRSFVGDGARCLMERALRASGAHRDPAAGRQRYGSVQQNLWRKLYVPCTSL